MMIRWRVRRAVLCTHDWLERERGREREAEEERKKSNTALSLSSRSLGHSRYSTFGHYSQIARIDILETRNAIDTARSSQHFRTIAHRPNVIVRIDESPNKPMMRSSHVSHRLALELPHEL